MISDSAKLIFLDTVDSTNSYLSELLKKEFDIPEYSMVLAYNQTSGRGQRGTAWETKEGECLTFSLILKPEFLQADLQFYISKIIAISILEYLEEIAPGFRIKWPNDIMYNGKKISGVLIENSISGGKLKNCIIGVGINVNQNEFVNLPGAISLFQITQKSIEIEEVMMSIVAKIKKNYIFLKEQDFENINLLYHQNLYLYNESKIFNTEDKSFEGVIIGTEDSGRLLIKNENNEVLSFDIKEIRFS